MKKADNQFLTRYSKFTSYFILFAGLAMIVFSQSLYHAAQELVIDQASVFEWKVNENYGGASRIITGKTMECQSFMPSVNHLAPSIEVLASNELRSQGSILWVHLLAPGSDSYPNRNNPLAVFEGVIPYKVRDPNLGEASAYSWNKLTEKDNKTVSIIPNQTYFLCFFSPDDMNQVALGSNGRNPYSRGMIYKYGYWSCTKCWSWVRVTPGDYGFKTFYFQETTDNSNPNNNQSNSNIGNTPTPPKSDKKSNKSDSSNTSPNQPNKDNTEKTVTSLPEKSCDSLPIKAVLQARLSNLMLWDTRVDLNWQINANTQYDQVAIFRAHNPSEPYQEIKRLSKNYQAYSDRGVSLNQTYLYRIIILNGEHEIGQSEEVLVQTTPNLLDPVNNNFSTPKVRLKYKTAHSLKIAWKRLSQDQFDSIILSIYKDNTLMNMVILSTNERNYNFTQLERNTKYKIEAVYRTKDGVNSPKQTLIAQTAKKDFRINDPLFWLGALLSFCSLAILITLLIKVKRKPKKDTVQEMSS